MKSLALVLAGAAPLALAACAPKPAPQPAPPPVATPAPSPTPTPSPVAAQPAYANWMDAPQTPGDWHYADDGNFRLAGFGVDRTEQGTEFILSCDQARQRIALARKSRASAPVVMSIRTETMDRTLTAKPRDDHALVLVALPASDPLFDAMAFSRGRFAVETEGEPTLYLPSWPEVTRVIEDCR